MKFCGQCGRSLNRPCPYCTYENPANFKFCGQCGTALSEPADRPSPLEIDRPGPAQTEPERRQLTVMFCDLVGSTRLSQQLDPEELHQVVGAYQAVCVAVIDRFEGHVAQYLGDGLLVYFGYPAAHEDDAPRAVQAGLGIIAAIERLNTRLAEEMKLELSLRLGIHTGLVVVGPIGSGERHERLALGDTPNIAARLQQLAAPNTILVSPTTHRLVDRLFASQALGPQTLTGLAGPLAVYQILHERGHLSRLEATAMAARLSPLIGREQELALLLARWDQVKEGVGQVVSLNGEAGIGKSRLLHDLKSHLAGQPQLWLEGQCSPYYKNSAFYPLIELAGQQIFCFERADTPRQKLAKLEATVNRLDGRPGLRVNPAEAIPLLAGFLSLPLEPDYDRLTLSPQRQKQRTLETLLTLLFALAGEQPLLLVWEDLHWADPSTLEFIDLLIRPGSPAPIFVLLTFRPTFTPPWSGRSQLTHLI
jgi:class 3 adenylate cyclase